MAAVALWQVRPSEAALRPATVAAVASPSVGADAGVAAVCAVAGVVPAVRVRVERVPWAVGSGVFTAPFEELAAYLRR